MFGGSDLPNGLVLFNMEGLQKITDVHLPFVPQFTKESQKSMILP